MSSWFNTVELLGQCENSEGDVFDFKVEVTYKVMYDRGDYYNPSSNDVEFDSYESEIIVDMGKDVGFSDIEFDSTFKVLKYNNITNKFEKYEEIYYWIVDMAEQVEYDFYGGSYSDSEEYYRDDEF